MVASADLPEETISMPKQTSGLTSKGEALYLCGACQRNKVAALFHVKQSGEVSDFCLDCWNRIRDQRPIRHHNLRKREHVTVTEKQCKLCGEIKPADRFYIERRNTGGLKGICISCERKRTESRRTELALGPAPSVVEEQAKEIIDQAICERDEALQHAWEPVEKAIFKQQVADHERWLARLMEQQDGMEARLREMILASRPTTQPQVTLRRLLAGEARRWTAELAALALGLDSWMQDKEKNSGA